MDSGEEVEYKSLVKRLEDEISKSFKFTKECILKGMKEDIDLYISTTYPDLSKKLVVDEKVLSSIIKEGRSLITHLNSENDKLFTLTCRSKEKEKEVDKIYKAARLSQSASICEEIFKLKDAVKKLAKGKND